jgi:hypothetical protein
MTYFTDARMCGPLVCIPIPWSIGVTESPRDHTRVGVAVEVGRTETRNPVWSLTIHGYAVHGLFVVDHGRFVPIEPASNWPGLLACLHSGPPVFAGSPHGKDSP